VFANSFLGIMVAIGIVNATACGDSSQPPDPKPQNDRVNFKGGKRLATDLGISLDLEKSEICNELGQYNCTDLAHNITLGGVEPYLQTIYQPIQQLSMSTLNAVDRTVLGACSRRAERDFAEPGTAVVFGAIAGSKGASVAAIRKLSNELYQRLLGRNANRAELDALVKFYEELKATESAPAQAFAIHACFAIATTEESLFY
jgi:hypothetical protein